jgi:hypothetical protein
MKLSTVTGTAPFVPKVKIRQDLEGQNRGMPTIKQKATIGIAIGSMSMRNMKLSRSELHRLGLIPAFGLKIVHEFEDDALVVFIRLDQLL